MSKTYVRVYTNAAGDIRHVYTRSTPFRDHHIEGDEELTEEEFEIDSDRFVKAQDLRLEKLERVNGITRLKPGVRSMSLQKNESHQRIIRSRIDQNPRPQPTVEEIEARIAQAQSDLAELKRSS